MTYGDPDLEAISLLDRLPFKALVRFGDRLYIDFAAVGEAVAGFCRAVGAVAGDDYGNVKGRAFEDAVAALGVGAGLEPWLTRFEVETVDGTKREIDASFLVDDVLWIVECKAHSQDPKIDSGDYGKLKGRRKKLEDELDYAGRLATLLRENRKGQNYRVPDHVARVDHCLVTSNPEWIWTEDRSLWLTDDVPRICTPHELMEVLGAA